MVCGSPKTRPKTHAKVNLAAKRHTQRPGEAKTHHTEPPAGAHRVSSVHRAPRDSNSNRANRAQERLRAVTMPLPSGMSGRAASVAAWIRAVCEHAAAAAPHVGAENVDHAKLPLEYPRGPTRAAFGPQMVRATYSVPQTQSRVPQSRVPGKDQR